MRQLLEPRDSEKTRWLRVRPHSPRGAVFGLTVACSSLLIAASTQQGCLEVRGGAVEVTWVLRDDQETARSCSDLGVTRIEITVVRADDPTNADLCSAGQIGRCVFDCDDGYGITPFRIPDSTYYFGLKLLDENGAPIGSKRAQVPAPVVRRVTEGTVLDLGVWQLVVTPKSQ